MREKLEVFIHDKESIGDFPMKKIERVFFIARSDQSDAPVKNR